MHDLTMKEAWLTDCGTQHCKIRIEFLMVLRSVPGHNSLQLFDEVMRVL